MRNIEVWINGKRHSGFKNMFEAVRLVSSKKFPRAPGDIIEFKTLRRRNELETRFTWTVKNEKKVVLR